MTSVDGLITGLDTTSIIEQLLAAERIPQNQLLLQKARAEAKVDVFADLRSRYDAVKTAARDLDLPDDWARLAATSSSELVKVSAGSGSITGAVTFTVLQRAAAHAVYSTDTVTSLDTVVAPGGNWFSASGYEALGFSGLSGSGLAEGPQTFEVTQDSAVATKTGAGAVPEPHTITVANDTIELQVNGTGYTLDIAAGLYTTREDLRAAIETEMGNKGLSGILSVRLDGSDQLEFVTTREGSEASIQVTGGDGIADLGLAVDATPLTGTDGIVSVNGTETTITNTDVGTQVVLDAGTGTITATFAGGVRTGTADVELVPFGGGTLTEVVDAINSSPGLGAKAAIIQVDEGEYRLQITAGETGDDSAIDPDLLAQFTGLASGFTTLSNGQDARLRIEGVNPYTINSSSDTFKDLMPGLDVTLAGIPTEQVVVDLTRDSGTIADRVQALVDAINKVVTGFDEASKYDADTDQAALLTGNSTVRRARDELTSAFIGSVTGASLGSVGLTGVSIQNDGTFKFDRAVFSAAYEDDPAAVERVYAAPFESGDDSAVGRILAEIEDATAFGTGYLRTAEEAEEARVEDLDNSIDAWDRRLEIREQVLRSTYIRLETALAQLQSQSTWLAGQIANLSTPSSNAR